MCDLKRFKNKASRCILSLLIFLSDVVDLANGRIIDSGQIEKHAVVVDGVVDSMIDDEAKQFEKASLLLPLHEANASDNFLLIADAQFDLRFLHMSLCSPLVFKLELKRSYASSNVYGGICSSMCSSPRKLRRCVGYKAFPYFGRNTACSFEPYRLVRP